MAIEQFHLSTTNTIITPIANNSQPYWALRALFSQQNRYREMSRILIYEYVDKHWFNLLYPIEERCVWSSDK
jgi:hypothetical protein